MKNVIGRITISGENAIRSKRFGGRMRSKAPGRVKKTGKVMEMASRLFQSIVLQMKDTVDRTIGIVDASGAVVACTDLPRIGEMREEAITELGFAGEIVRFGGYTYHITGRLGWNMPFSCRARMSLRAASVRLSRYPSIILKHFTTKSMTRRRS